MNESLPGEIPKGEPRRTNADPGTPEPGMPAGESNPAREFANPAPETGGPAAGPEARVLKALSGVVDPELGCNVVDLGLVYGVEVTDCQVRVDMTMTTAACPLGDYLATEAEMHIRRELPEMRSVRVNLVWEPPWSPEKMSGAARERLGWR